MLTPLVLTVVIAPSTARGSLALMSEQVTCGVLGNGLDQLPFRLQVLKLDDPVVQKPVIVLRTIARCEQPKFPLGSIDVATLPVPEHPEGVWLKALALLAFPFTFPFRLPVSAPVKEVKAAVDATTPPVVVNPPVVDSTPFCWSDMSGDEADQE